MASDVSTTNLALGWVCSRLRHLELNSKGTANRDHSKIFLPDCLAKIYINKGYLVLMLKIIYKMEAQSFQVVLHLSSHQ